MTLAIIISIGGLIIVAQIIVIVIILSRSRNSDQTSSVALIKSDVTELTRQISELQVSVGDRLEKNSASMQASLTSQLKESATLIKDVTGQLTELRKTNEQVVGITDELKLLQNILQNPKQRGGLGEYYLETVLANVLPPQVYETQYSFKNGEIVDAVVHVDGKRIIPIDSKFSLENYNRLIEAKDKVEREIHAKQFKIDLKNRIDETSKYIIPKEGTLDYAFMFIPSEAIYYDLLVNKVGATGTNARDLIEYAFVDKKVIIVSPTTLLAYLQTVMQGLRSLKIEEQAKDIKERLQSLDKNLKSHEVYMSKLGGSLGTAVGHFNNAHKSFSRIDKDIVKITDGESSVERALLIEKPLEDE